MYWFRHTRKCSQAFRYKKQVFESVLRAAHGNRRNRQSTLVAQIDIGEVNTELYLYNFRQLPVFRIVAMLSPLVDIVYGEKSYIEYKSVELCYFLTVKQDATKANGCKPWAPTLPYLFEYPMNINPIPPNITYADPVSNSGTVLAQREAVKYT